MESIRCSMPVTIKNPSDNLMRDIKLSTSVSEAVRNMFGRGYLPDVRRILKKTQYDIGGSTIVIIS